MQRILKSYLFWTYPRGSFHYDVMVTVILLFLFVSPKLINYRDRPQETLTSTKDILVRANGPNSWTYQIGADQLADTSNEDKLKAELLQRIQAISGNVAIDRYREQKDAERPGDPVPGLGTPLGQPGQAAKYFKRKTRNGPRLVQQPIRRSMVHARVLQERQLLCFAWE